MSYYMYPSATGIFQVCLKVCITDLGEAAWDSDETTDLGVKPVNASTDSTAEQLRHTRHTKPPSPFSKIGIIVPYVYLTGLLQ